MEYGYDALGRLKTVHVIRRNNATVNETTTYTYTKVGSRETVTLPNGTVTTWQYDTLNRLTNLTHRAGNNALLASYSYQLHPTGRRTNATEIVLNTDDNSYVTNTTTWWYDGMYRLTNEVTSSTSPTASMSHSTAYEYDLAGNRTKRVQGSETVTYQYNANDQLTNEVSSVSGATTYKYDGNGSLTNKTVGSTITSYTYNLANKLASVMSGSTVLGSYQYNDQGIRVRKTEGSTTYYLVDANNHTGYAQVLEESASIGGAPSISYVLGDDVLGQCGSTTSDPGWFLYDGHGSTRQLVHSAVNVTSQFHYDAYGQSLTTLGTPETTMLYSGEQYDTTLGMYNLRARYYNPSNGRFNAMDSFRGNNSDPQSLHKYGYCHSDPVNGIDPSGRYTLTESMVALTIAAILFLLLVTPLVTHPPRPPTVWISGTETTSTGTNPSQSPSPEPEPQRKPPGPLPFPIPFDDDDDSTLIHRMGGRNNLAIGDRERTLNPPGISVLMGGTAETAALQMRAAFSPQSRYPRLWNASRTVGTATLASIRSVGFDVKPDPSDKFPNHGRLYHNSRSASAFDNPVLLRLLSATFTDTIVPIE